MPGTTVFILIKYKLIYINTMHILHKTLCILLILCFINTGNITAQTSISVSDFGLKPDTRENAVLYIQKALEACKDKDSVILSFPRGRYDFWPQYAKEKDYYETNTYDVFPKRLAILLEEINHFTLDGNGSEFIMHDRIQPLTVERCNHITLKNFSIDWDIPLTSQAEIISIGDEYIDLKINTLQYPYIIENEKLVFTGEGWKSAITLAMEFNPNTGLIEPQTGGQYALGKGWKEYKASSSVYGIVRMRRDGGFKRYPAIGNVLVLRHSTRDHAGIFICNSSNVNLSGIQLHHAAGLGILAQYSENLSFKQVNAVPNAQKGRLFSGHDDGFHLMGCKGNISVDSCRWAGLMDDPINIHGTCVKIVDILSTNKIKCRFMHEMSRGMIWGMTGDKIGFIENKSMETYATTTIKNLKIIDINEFEIELPAPAPESLKIGDALENLTWTPDVDIRNSFFGSCRARGILVSTPGKVVIENNIFESSGSAILIAGDANNYYESGGVKDVRIAGNEFRYPCMSSYYEFCEAVITIKPTIPEPDINKPFHRNIRILNNKFNPFDYPIIYALSVDGLQFKNNTIERNHTFKPFNQIKDGITLIKCRNEVIKNNIITGDVLSSKNGKLTIVKK